MKRLIPALIWGFSCFYFNSTNAQDPEFEKLFQQFPNYNSLPKETQLQKIDLLVSAAIQKKDWDLAFNGNYLNGTCYLSQSKNDLAKKYFQHARIYAKKCSKINYQAWANERLALIYSKKGIIDSTVSHYLRAIALFKKFDTYNYAHAINNLGETYFKLGAYRTALNYYTHALEIKKSKEKWESGWAYAYWNMAEVYYELKETDSAWHYYEKASESALKIRAIPYYANEGFARINMDRGNYPRALKELSEIKKWYFETQNPLWIADMGLLYMEIYHKRNEQKPFRYWSEVVKKCIHREYIPEQKRKFYHLMASHFKSVNKLDSAVYYQEEALKAWEENYIKHGLTSINQLAQSQEQMIVANNLLRSQQDLQKIKLDHEQVTSRNLRLAHRNSVLWIFIVLTLIVLILAGIFSWITMRLRNKTHTANKRLIEKEERIRETQMLNPQPFAVVKRNGGFLSCNQAFIELFGIDPTNQNQTQTLLAVLPPNLQMTFSEIVTVLSPFKKQTSLWIWENRGEKFAVQFSIINLTEDPTVNGFILEGINQTAEYRRQMQEAEQTEQELAEKEAQLADLSLETAISQLELESNRKVLSSLKEKLISPYSYNQTAEIKQLLLQEKNQEKFWKNYTTHYNRANKGLIDLLLEKHPSLTQNELKHFLYIDMQLSNKEVSRLLGITDESVKKARQRLKKKLGLSTDTTLKSYLNEVVHASVSKKHKNS